MSKSNLKCLEEMIGYSYMYMFAIESTKCMGELPFCLKIFSYNLPQLRFGVCIYYVPSLSCNYCFANISNNASISVVRDSKTIH